MEYGQDERTHDEELATLMELVHEKKVTFVAGDYPGINAIRAMGATVEEVSERRSVHLADNI